MSGYSGGNSNFGGNGPVDVRCTDCGWVGSYASYILSPTSCGQMVDRGGQTRRCGGQVIPMNLGGGSITHFGH